MLLCRSCSQADEGLRCDRPFRAILQGPKVCLHWPHAVKSFLLTGARRATASTSTARRFPPAPRNATRGEAGAGSDSSASRTARNMSATPSEVFKFLSVANIFARVCRKLSMSIDNLSAHFRLAGGMAS